MNIRTKQIKLISKKLYQLWTRHPKLRFFQIIEIMTAKYRSESGKGFWDISDKKLYEQIIEELNK